jgi:hypothetical protein
MNWRNMLSLSAVAAMAFASVPDSAVGQQKSLKEQLVGAWTFVSQQYKFPDGRTSDIFGPNAKGILIVEASGRVAYVSMRASLPKFASNDRLKGTTEENKAVVEGSYAYFGTYAVNEADRTFTVHVEGATFPNFEGADQIRTFTLAGDELRYTNPVATIGQGVIVEAVWKRAK